MPDVTINYTPGGPTLSRFHQSGARRRMIVGPVGSGTSTSCCMEGVRRSLETTPCVDGVRRSRGVIIRRTFGDLERTTIPTWKIWTEGAFGAPVRRTAGFVHNIRRPLEDGTVADAEIIFFSMAKEADVQRLLSLELTWAFVNEARELPKPIFDALDDRIGRFPSKAQLDGRKTFFGWWADTNPPDTDHWIYRSFEEHLPEGYDYFRQPGGLIRDGKGGWIVNPEAENLHNLNEGGDYYLTRMQGKGDDHIAVYYGGEYGFVREGRRIISDYNDRIHCAERPLDYDPEVPELYIGIDFGATPAAAISQCWPGGRWRVIEELTSEKVGIGAFASDVLKPRLTQLQARGFRPSSMILTGDPAGSGTSQTDGKTPFKMLEEAGIKCDPAYSNDFWLRTEVLNSLCRQMVDGEPRFMISPNCRLIRKGLARV